ncbi:MAG TPA: hypothetical protein PK228_00590 [Saprospiraceae bacterium]|nr:hypothetical protein [Saprospiraceae bacterium]
MPLFESAAKAAGTYMAAMMIAAPLCFYFHPIVMPKSIRFISLLFFAAFFLLLFACGKEDPSPTVINGKVTDKKTGEPIEGAAIGIDFQTEKTVSGSLKTEHEYVSLSTDAQGEFQYTHNADYTYTNSDIGKQGYAPQSPLKIKKGEVNILEIQLIPEDATLRLELSNDSGQYGAIYVVLKNPSYGSLYAINLPQFPVTLPIGEKYVTYFALPSEEFTKVHWGFTYFPGASAAPFRDSVYLTVNDTTDYILSF